jgi:hypothetical protein
LHPRPGFTADRQRRVLDVTEASHAQFGQRSARGKASGHVDAGVKEARAARQMVDGDAQLGRTLGAPIRDRPGAFVHPTIGRFGRHFRCRVSRGAGLRLQFPQRGGDLRHSSIQTLDSGGRLVEPAFARERFEVCRRIDNEDGRHKCGCPPQRVGRRTKPCGVAALDGRADGLHVNRAILEKHSRDLEPELSIAAGLPIERLEIERRPLIVDCHWSLNCCEDFPCASISCSALM